MSTEEVAVLVKTLLTYTEEEFAAWITSNRHSFHLDLVWHIRNHYAGNNFAVQNGLLSEKATRYGLAIATVMVDEPLAMTIAQWARGDYAMFYEPKEAITMYRNAIAGLEKWGGEALAIARIYVALVGILTHTSAFKEAEAAYQQAFPHIFAVRQGYPRYYLALLQNYGWSLHGQGRHQQALQIYEEALQFALAQAQTEGAELSDIIVELRINYAVSAGVAGSPQKAVAALLEQLQPAKENGDVLTVARIHMDLGHFYTALGQPAQAWRHFNLARHLFAETNNRMELGNTLLLLALLLQRLGSRRSAIRYYRDAIELFTELEMPSQIGEAVTYYATARRLEREYQAASSLLKQAQEIWQSLEQSYWLSLIQLEQISIAINQKCLAEASVWGQQPLPASTNQQLQAEKQLLLADLLQLTGGSAALAEAQALLEQCYQYGLQQGNRWLQRQAQVGLGKMRRLSDESVARQHFIAAVAIDEQIRKVLSVEEIKAGFHAQAAALFTPLIQIAVKHGDIEQALRWIWQAKGAPFLELLQGVLAERVLSPTTAHELARARQQLATLRYQQELQRQIHQTHWSHEQAQPAITALENQILELRRQRAWHEAEAVVVTAPELAEVHRKIDTDLLLEYICCDDELIGVSIDGHGHCLLKPLAKLSTLDSLLRRWRLQIPPMLLLQPAQRKALLAARLAESHPILEQCFELLVAPLLADRKPKRILLAPCTPISDLPFAALRQNGRYWIEWCELELVPTGSLLTAPPRVAPLQSPPFFVAAQAGLATMTRDATARIAKQWPGATARIDGAALADLRNCPVPPKYLHFGVHSLLRKDAPIFHGLQLGNEVLSVEECYELPVEGTELVALFGCSTREGMDSGGALLAFQSAFFLAGAHRVLASLWTAADDATAVWIEHFYPLLQAGYSVPEAVQRTQQALLTDERYAHPVFWALFASTRR